MSDGNQDIASVQLAPSTFPVIQLGIIAIYSAQALYGTITMASGKKQMSYGYSPTKKFTIPDLSVCIHLEDAVNQTALRNDVQDFSTPYLNTSIFHGWPLKNISTYLIPFSRFVPHVYIKGNLNYEELFEGTDFKISKYLRFSWHVCYVLNLNEEKSYIRKDDYQVPPSIILDTSGLPHAYAQMYTQRHGTIPAMNTSVGQSISGLKHPLKLFYHTTEVHHGKSWGGCETWPGGRQAQVFREVQRFSRERLNNKCVAEMVNFEDSCAFEGYWNDELLKAVEEIEKESDEEVKPDCYEENIETYPAFMGEVIEISEDHGSFVYLYPAASFVWSQHISYVSDWIDFFTFHFGLLSFHFGLTSLTLARTAPPFMKFSLRILKIGLSVCIGIFQKNVVNVVNVVINENNVHVHNMPDVES